MKKIILIFVLMIGVLNAKQFASCDNTYVGTPHNIKHCMSGNTPIKNIDDVSDMYRKGWRLITVNTVYVNHDSSYITYFYFEK